MFPYPSGAGLLLRRSPSGISPQIFMQGFKKRHQGFNVLHPIGYDLSVCQQNNMRFNWQHPAITTEQKYYQIRRRTIA